MSDMLGPYEIRGELGRGAMAVVWRGFDTRLERDVAIKEPVIPQGTDSAAAAELAARFVREGQAAAKLNHPGIVTIHAAEVFDGRAAIVMEVIEGETLATIMDRGPLEPASALAVLDQLLDAVGFAHSKGVVHRDIKPDNVFVTHDGRVKLADFGIAHVGTGASLTQAGTVMGTPGYMAPEQVTGQPVDSRADIFVIGVIGFEMLTGHNPFGATDGIAPTTIMYRIVHEPAPALPPEAFAGLPADLGYVLATALAKDPTDRFADTHAFRSALAGGPVVTARQSGTVPVAATIASGFAPSGPQFAPAITNWTPYLVLGAAVLLVVGGLFFFSGTPTRGTVPIVSATPTETATIEAEGSASGSASPSERDITYMANAHASSTLPKTPLGDYRARNLLDGDSETCWAEGIEPEDTGKDYGIGEYVDISFGESVSITDIEVIPGYDKNPGDFDRWRTNGRLKEAEFVFDSGQSVTHLFADKRKFQSISLDAPIQASSVRMYIRSVYKAAKHKAHKPTADTSIAEFRVTGWPQSEVQ